MTRFWKRSNLLDGKKRTLFVVNLVLLFAVLTFFNLSCSKYPSKVGAELMPNNALSMHHTQDTFRVYSNSIDTTRSDKLPVCFLGSLKDPVFGETNAGFYTQILLSSTKHRFGKNPQMDSLILQLTYADVYGDSNAVLKVHVYEMKDDICFDSIYYSNKKIAVYPTDYADAVFHPDKNNYYLFPSGINDTLFDTVKGVVRFNLSRLSPALGNKLLRADTTVLDSTALFLNYFKGLYLTVDPANNIGALASFSVNSYKTYLTLYYHNDDKDSLQFNFVISPVTAHFNRYDHDYSIAEPDFIKQIVNRDTTLGQKRFYVQGLAGVQTIIKFPHIRDLNKLGKVGINEAKLILPGAESTPFLEPPAHLSLIKLNKDHTYSKLPDEDEGPDYFGGYYNSTTNSYSFRITRYIESLVKDSTKADYGLVLYVNSGAIDPKRFVFNGPEFKGDSTRRAKLDILYTIVK